VTDRVVSFVSSVARAMRAVLGAPDYDRYLEHCRLAHPDRAPLTSEQFYRERMEARYNKPGSKCC